MLILGKNPEISNSAYHADREYVSSTGLKTAYKDMREFYHQYVLGDMSNALNSAAAEFGRLMHSMLLEPEQTDKEYIFWSGIKRGKDWDRFKLQHLDKTILNDSQKDKAKFLCGEFNKQTILLEHDNKTKEVLLNTFFTKGEAESTFTTEIDGLKVKVRADYLKHFPDFISINDLKTVGDDDLSKDSVKKICARLGYDLSAALYCDVVAAVTGQPTKFFLIFLSTVSGKSRIYKCSDEMLEEGRRKYKIGIQNILQARESGIYYKNEIEEI
jgi:hypothetical protein